MENIDTRLDLKTNFEEIIPKYDKNNIIWPILSIIFIIIVLIVCILIIKGEFNQEESTITCPKSFCIVNILTGEKKCPIGDERLEAKISIETCNTPEGCTSDLTKCVYESKSIGTSCPGDLNYTGLCENNETCTCTNRVFCPDWSLVYFKPVSVIETGTEIGRALIQETIWTKPNNVYSQDVPISLGNYYQTESICGV